MMEWTLVTGGADRLGAAICRALAKKGMSVLVHYHTSKEKAQETAQSCRRQGVAAELIEGDFSSLETTNAFIVHCLAKFPEIKSLVNNVGQYLLKSAIETSVEEWQLLFQTNLHAPFALCRAFLPSIQRYRGSILNIGMTGLTAMRADTQRTAYMVTKSAFWNANEIVG